MNDYISCARLFDLEKSIAGAYLNSFTYVWLSLCGLKEFIFSTGLSLGEDYREIETGVWAHVSARISPTARICAPCIISEYAEVRHCAYIRGSVIIGRGCVVGNSTEVKNAVLFDGAAAPHFNYVGDSILGHRAHLGAGVILSNLKWDKSSVTVRADMPIYTGLKKLGAILGDGAEVGCNSVLNPGTIICKNSAVYPLSSVRGVVPPDSILRQDGSICRKHK